MIEKTGASGWMNDFGEALPYDGKLHDGAGLRWSAEPTADFRRLAAARLLAKPVRSGATSGAEAASSASHSAQAS